ncbi:hypothetical protein AKJ09_10354 [Labilithrix luteola]|uniref:Uncharacterized protein n=1 Tax=Labilithrix luteola TaxID=1391654 RepID=A0A0K1QD31_9BACT|nr:hypothetical protein [Labilithrix luteola]AKV03691.1 hypothetical protein AKJ09_10354 [Labilithrix luteola]
MEIVSTVDVPKPREYALAAAVAALIWLLGATGACRSTRPTSHTSRPPAPAPTSQAPDTSNDESEPPGTQEAARQQL